MKNVISAFKEYKEFNNNKPWDVNLMLFPGNEVVPPHYAETIEVLLCYDLKGKINIGTHMFTLGGKQAFYIAPGIIHSMNYEQNDGKIYVLKLELNYLKKYMDINAVAKDCGIELTQPYCLIEDFDSVADITRKIADSENSVTEKLTAVINLLDVIIGNSNKDTAKNLSAVNDKDLYAIINWTESNFRRRITLEEVATVFGYNNITFAANLKMP